ncbi:hypothetical protein GX411_00195 [Candidatus Fermentibacteria bacterium]|nr:hypothetical protein [Candidatus Fermentibacteria bacterium]
MAVTVLLAAVSALWLEPPDGLSWSLCPSPAPAPASCGLLVLPAMPNPCTGSASIGLVDDGTGEVRVALCDLEADLVEEEILLHLKPGQYELALSGLEPGAYLCLVSSGGVVESDTIIVEP